MPETRSKSSNKVMDERLQAVEQQLTTVTTLQESVFHMTTQLQAMARNLEEVTTVLQNPEQPRLTGRPNGNNNGRSRATQFTKMEFPRFSRTDVVAWILKCERFFELDETAADAKVKIASLHLDDRAFQWHIACEKQWAGNPPSWEEYVALLKDCFGPAYESPIGDLLRLRHKGTLADFNEEFDLVSAKVGFNETQLVDAYLNLIKEEIAGPVRMFKPKSMREAKSLARMQELTNERLGEKKPWDKGPKIATPVNWVAPASRNTSSWSKEGHANSGPHPKGNFNSATTKPQSFAIKNSPRVSKASTAEEEAEHRQKNLCFYCHDKFSKDHKCPQRRRMLLHFIEYEEAEVENDPDLELVAKDDEVTPTISLHAISGVDDADSMRLQGYVGRRPIQILIDNGSTHDFLDLTIAQKLGWKTDYVHNSHVQVAGGKMLKVHGLWRDFKWKMQGLDFTFDFRILDLHTYDMVLGVKWLKSIKNAFWDYERMVMYFWKNDQICKLQANPPNTWQIIQSQKAELNFLQHSQKFLVHLVQANNRELECFSVSSIDENATALIQKTLDGFQDIFREPRELPPLREGHNHPIILQEGTDPISIKPYRYPAAQKDVIEKLITELLHQGFCKRVLLLSQHQLS
ncbi:uncharacterized protein LOC114747408 [Neltuma alba]|uniref:uncharacterized protein LOC114747408 n=1 Tax=Neltuma alba TaxID=207710 RepID=UPI0010A31E67|nr:uncharacterized protein LOC114747408 [Prosopis alba]